MSAKESGGPPPKATSALDAGTLPRLSWPASAEELRAYVTASRAQQGLPAAVENQAPWSGRRPRCA